MATPEEKIKKLVDALEFAQGAIFDAIFTEDGLDGAAGEKVLKVIVSSLYFANHPEAIRLRPQGDPI